MTKNLTHTVIFTHMLAVSLALWFNMVNAQNIWDINASFCEPSMSTNEMNITTQANRETEICINFKNESTVDSKVSINFINWILNANWNKSCINPSGTELDFGQYISDYQNTLDIPSNTEITQKYKIKFPIWFSWVSHWCLAYSIHEEESSDANISMLFRKVHTIDILVGWVEISSKINPKNISISWDEWSNWIIFNIKNDGNVDQQINISGNIKNRFWYKKDFKIDDVIIKSNDTQNLISEKIILPEYKGLFSINFEINNDPVLNFNTTNKNLNNQYSAKWTESFTKHLILRNKFYIISIIIILLLSSVVILRRYKK